MIKVNCFVSISFMENSQFLSQSFFRLRIYGVSHIWAFWITLRSLQDNAIICVVFSTEISFLNQLVRSYTGCYCRLSFLTLHSFSFRFKLLLSSTGTHITKYIWTNGCKSYLWGGPSSSVPIPFNSLWWREQRYFSHSNILNNSNKHFLVFWHIFWFTDLQTLRR